MAKTHSSLTFDELCEEAFGDIGLHPWEFYEYDLYDYLLKRAGMVKAQRRNLKLQFQHVQIAAYYTILPYLEKKDRRKKIDELIPNIYDDKATPVVNLKEHYEELQKKYAGIIDQPLNRKRGSKRD